MKKQHCKVHTDTELRCPRCDAEERGRKGGAAKSAKQSESRRLVMAKINGKRAEEAEERERATTIP